MYYYWHDPRCALRPGFTRYPSIKNMLEDLNAIVVVGECVTIGSSEGPLKSREIESLSNEGFERQGRTADYLKVQCSECAGTGMILSLARENVSTCPICRGRGVA